MTIFISCQMAIMIVSFNKNKGKLHFTPLKFTPNCNFASKVKKVAIDPNKVSKICNVAIPLAFFV